MDNTELIESDLVVDDENLLIKTEIQDVDNIDVDKDAEEDFVATLVLSKFDRFLIDCSINRKRFHYKSLKRKRVVTWLRLEMVQECDNVAEYKNRGIEVISEKYILRRWRSNIIPLVKKKHKEIWREVEVQVPKPLSWTPENVIEDIDVVEQATNAS
ncbi:hypothetical protein Tco_0806409 [Tanacetum coccineum]